jgi:hypothetical protein
MCSHHFTQVFAASQNRLALQDQVGLGWIIIDQPHDIALQ